MAIQREVIYTALFERLRENLKGPVRFFTREGITFDDLTNEKLPAMSFVVTDQEPEVVDDDLPIKWHLGALIVLFASYNGRDSADVLLNQMVDLVEQALERPETEPPGQCFTTLGGKVHHVRISGAVQFAQGSQGDQAAAIIPVEMLATA